MDPIETIRAIKELCEDAGEHPQYLTFHTIYEWVQKQLEDEGDVYPSRHIARYPGSGSILG